MPGSDVPGPDVPGSVPPGGLTPGERGELERLRSEVVTLRTRPPARSRRRVGWRAPVASVLIVLGCLFAPLSVIAVWGATQVSSTDRYVANVDPLIHDPAVQRTLTDKITNQITSRLDVQGLTNGVAATLTQRGLTRAGSLLHSLSGSIAGAVDGFIRDRVAKLVASPQAARLWTQVNRTAHDEVVKVLSGQGPSAITIQNGQAVIDLAPFIDLAKKDLSDRGLTVVNQIPTVHPTVTLFSAKELVRFQTFYRVLLDLRIVLPVLTFVLLGLGVYVARSHRRALIGAGLGFSASMLVLAAALAVLHSVYLSSVPNDVLPGDAAAALFDTLVRFITDGIRLLLVVGLLVAIGAFFTGPSVTAVRTRRALSAGTGWLRASGARAGLRTGPAGRWTYGHRRGLRVAAVFVAALIFVFWSDPTGLVAIVIAVCLLAVLGLIELIATPPVPPAAQGHHGSA